MKRKFADAETEQGMSQRIISDITDYIVAKLNIYDRDLTRRNPDASELAIATARKQEVESFACWLKVNILPKWYAYDDKCNKKRKPKRA